MHVAVFIMKEISMLELQATGQRIKGHSGKPDQENGDNSDEDFLDDVVVDNDFGEAAALHDVIESLVTGFDHDPETLEALEALFADFGMQELG